MNNDRRSELKTAALQLKTVAEGIEAARAAIENVKAEEQEAFDNMSEGRQGGDAGQTAEAAIAAMETALDGLDVVDLQATAEALEEAAGRSFGVDLPEGKLSAGALEERKWDRVPKFAKDRIAQLERQLEAAAEEAKARFSDPVEGSKRPVCADYASPLQDKELPVERVRFPQVGITVSVSTRRGGKPVLEIHGSGSLSIFSESSNVIFTRADDRWG